IRSEAAGQVLDDDRLAGVGDLAQDAAGETGEPVALRPGVEVLGEAGRAGDEVERGLDAAPGESDIVLDRDELADPRPIGLDQFLRVGDAGDGLHRAVDDGQFLLPGAAVLEHWRIVKRSSAGGHTRWRLRICPGYVWCVANRSVLLG